MPSLWLSVLCWFSVAATEAIAAEKRIDEYDLKVAYLYNFTKFIRWPKVSFPNQEQPFHICISGPLPAVAIIDQLESKTTNGRSLKVVSVTQIKADHDCHILYFREVSPKEVENTLKSLKNKPILTVGDFSGFAESGGIVEYYFNSRNRIELIINLEKAKIEGIEISAQLLEIASIVHQVGRL